jgi:oligopeptidase B
VVTVRAPTPPRAKAVDVVHERHGRRVPDPYAWLRDESWREVMRDPARLDPAIRAHLEAENAYTAAMMADTADLQRRLVAEMRGRIKEDDATVPLPDGPYAYYMRWRTGGQQPLFCRHPTALPDQEEVLLDGDAEAAGRGYLRIAAAMHSPDHRLLAWAADETGSELFTIRVRDLASGRDLDDRIVEATPGFAWDTDGRRLLYVAVDADHRPSSARLHTLGEADDRIVHEEADPGFFVSVGATASRRFLWVQAHNHETSEWRLLAADDPGEARLVAPREPGVRYDVEHHGERLLIRTNADGAEDFKIVEVPLDDPDRRRWRDLVPHRPGRMILSLRPFADSMVRLERSEGLPRIVVTALADGGEHEIRFDEEAYSVALGGGWEFATDRLRLVYSSPATPPRTYDYDMVERRLDLLKQQEVPSGHDPSDYVVRRIEAPATDGEAVPITLVHRRDTPIDGTAPLLLYGYGAYGISLPADFSIARLSLVDRGVVWAQAHVRGGTEKGRRWYRLGKAAHKTNTFDDFVAAAEHLILSGWTAEGRIVAEGRSAGGMLMGAVANRAPRLFRAIVAGVPFVDVLNTMCDASLPLTPPEWPEWGNPIDDREAFERILSYSPYDNVTAQAYPHILAVAGLTDPRVTYWEPAKWIARLRAATTGDAPILLKTEMSAGHAGAAGRFDALEDTAFLQAFALKALGLADRPRNGR